MRRPTSWRASTFRASTTSNVRAHDQTRATNTDCPIGCGAARTASATSSPGYRSPLQRRRSTRSCRLSPVYEGAYLVAQVMLNGLLAVLARLGDVAVRV